MSCITHKPDMESIPVNLYLTNADDIKQLECTWPWPDNPTYTTHKVSDELQAWIQERFSQTVVVNYQVIHGQIPVHSDKGRSMCWNYIIEPGGQSPDTRFWNDEGTEIVERTDCKVHQWYQLDVSRNHDISYVEGYRINITVFEAEDELGADEWRLNAYK